MLIYSNDIDYLSCFSIARSSSSYYNSCMDTLIVSFNRQLPPPPMKIDFARLCKELREELGYTQDEMATFLGIAKRTYNYWESGEREPSARVAYWLAQIHDELEANKNKKEFTQ